jgi:hypothetical protein
MSDCAVGERGYGGAFTPVRMGSRALPVASWRHADQNAIVAERNRNTVLHVLVLRPARTMRQPATRGERRMIRGVVSAQLAREVMD